MKPRDNHGPCSPRRLSSSRLRRGTAKLITIDEQRRGRQDGGCVRPKPAYHRTESDSSLLSVGGRKRREAKTQQQTVQPAKAEVITTAESRRSARQGWRTASWPSAWQVRTCGKQPITVQRVTRPRSTSVDGRVARTTGHRGTANSKRAAHHHTPDARTGDLDHFGSSRIANIVMCGGQVTIASSSARGRLRGRDEPSQFGFVMKAVVEAGSQRAVGSSQIGEKPRV